MSDIADEAGVSRPALYPLFSSKEEIFSAVLERVLDAELVEVRARIAKADEPRVQVFAALDVWCARNYELTRASPGAADLFASSFEFAGKVAERATATFERILAEVLEPLVCDQRAVSLDALALARLVAQASVGLKMTAKNAKQLRASLKALVDVVLASLRE